jgi:HSP20 family protein
MTRTLSRWTHRFPQFSDFDREFPRWMSEVFAPETNLRDFEFLPEANVSETDKAIDVSIDLPGMKPEEVKVELHDRTLTISGERKEEKEENGKTFHRVERRSGSFRRSFALPMEVDESKADAKFEHGVLNITLPKTEKASPKKIEVKG